MTSTLFGPWIMKQKVALVATLLFLFIGSQAIASPHQYGPFADPVSGQPVAISVPFSELSSAKLRRDAHPSASDITDADAFSALERVKAEWGIAAPREQFLLVQKEPDDIGAAHFRFQQTVKGVPVFGSYLFVHFNKTQKRATVNGRISRGFLDDVLPRISPDEAVRRAQADWTRRFGEPSQFNYPPKLWVFDSTLVDEYATGQISLAYEVALGSQAESYRYLVSAKDGSISRRIPLSSNITLRWVYDCSLGNGCYRSIYSQSLNYTLGRSEGEPAVGANPILESLIQTYPFEVDRLYTSLGAAHDFYATKFNRNSANGQGGLGDGLNYPINSIPAAAYGDYKIPSMSCPNATFNPMYSRLEFCTGLNLIDVVGHEFTHGLIFWTANLQYQGQSGALNESFADIFGEAIERFGRGSHDWLLGASSLMGTFRSMAQPSAVFFDPYHGTFSNGSQPDRAYSPLFACGTQDYGGVHQNSGVLNYAAYLMAVGGSFNGCSINGIGEEKMERIMYRALTRYLGQTSKFYDAFAAILTSAHDLYSWEDLLEVRRALKAVEFDQALYCLGVPRSDPGADANGNGTSDCNDPYVTGVVPGKPSLKPGKNQVKITMPAMAGVKYYLKVTVKPAKGKTVTSYYISAARVATLKRVSSGSTVTVSFRYKLEGQTPLYSAYSAVAKAKIA